MITWLMRSVDAVTGDFPEDSFAGFLPPNDATHRGEGFASFVVRPKATLADGTAWTNQANIVFDANEPILTNVVTNTLDRTAPDAAMQPLASVSGRRIALSWSDADTGAGISHYELYVSDNGGAFVLHDGRLTDAAATFTGQLGHTYRFWVRAVDRLGQTVSLAPSGQAQTRSSESRLVNISSRGFNGTGDAAMIVGMVVRPGSGGAAKSLLIRGAGPQLAKAPFNLVGTLADPVLDLYNADGQPVLANDDWAQAANAGLLPAAILRTGAFEFDTGSRDSALLADLTPGVFTARAHGAAETTGLCLIEAYDADITPFDYTRPQILNLSTRGWVGTADDVLIAGFVVAGDVPKRLLIRAVGATLGEEPFNVPGVLTNPRLQLMNAAGQGLLANGNWEDGDVDSIKAVTTTVGAFPLPDGSTDAVILTTLAPGVYTAIVSGEADGTGIALVEIYDADP